MSMCLIKLISVDYKNTKYLINLFVLQWLGGLWKGVWLWRISGDCLRKQRKILNESHFFGSMAN